MAASPSPDDTSSINATRRILNVIRRDFLCRQKLAAEQCRTVLDLLQQLKKGCAAFRFLDLPPELREMIYGVAMEKHDDPDAYEQGFTTFYKQLPRMTNRVIAFRTTKIAPFRTASPLLLRVNRQVRSEAGKLYFESKRSEIFIDNAVSVCSLDEVKVWLKTIVGGFATHLRDVRVHTGCQAIKEVFVGTTIHARFHQNGLQITGCDASWDISDQDATPEDITFFDMPSVVASLEKNRIARGQRGEAIVDFFLTDPKALCRAWYGPGSWKSPEGHESFDSPENEWSEWGFEGQFGLFYRSDQSVERFYVRSDRTR